MKTSSKGKGSKGSSVGGEGKSAGPPPEPEERVRDGKGKTSENGDAAGDQLPTKDAATVLDEPRSDHVGDSAQEQTVVTEQPSSLFNFDQFREQDGWGLVEDSTSMSWVKSVSHEEPTGIFEEPEVYDKVAAYLVTSGLNPVGTEENLKAGLDILQEFQIQTNKAHHLHEYCFARFAFDKGDLLNILKVIVRKLKRSWEEWAIQNVKFMSARTRQAYMQLAKRKDAYPYCHLGEQRLLHLVTATEGSNSSDPIGDLLRKWGLLRGPEEDEPIESFKNSIDTAIALERASTQGVTKVTFGVMKGFISQKQRADAKFISELALIERNSGDPDAYIREMIANQGVRKEGSVRESKKESFEVLATKLEKVINAILTDLELLALVDKAKVDSLLAKLAGLKAQMSASN